jgi:hypothetical protein
MLEPLNHHPVQWRFFMSSITLHDLDDSLYAMLKEKANKEGISMNRTIKNLLEESLGLLRNDANRKRSVYAELCGAMPAEEADRLRRYEQDELEAVDAEDWL